MSDSSAVGALAAAGGGVLFASGWLVWIDGVAAAANDYGFGTPGADWVPGILQTVALLMVNAITWSAMADGGFDDSVAQKVKAWVFVSFVFAFSGLIASTYILVRESNSPTAPGSHDSAVRGLLQNLLIFGSSLLFRAGRLSDGD